MSQFEYIFVLVSIVVGLALTRLLDGLSQSIQKRVKEGGLDLAHLGFSVAVITLLIVVWWGMFRYADQPTWTFPKFLTLTIYVASFYALVAILYPTHRSTVPDFKEFRTLFYVVMAANLALELLNTYMSGDLFSPWYYMISTGHVLALSVLGIFIKRQQFDVIFSWWFVTLNIGWAFMARFTI